MLENPHIVPEEDGLYPDVLDVFYHQWDACSQSQLKTFERSPAHLKAERDHPPEHGAQKQANLDEGSAFHMVTLQPDEFPKWFSLRPAGNANSNAYKDKVAAILAENPFVRLLKPDAWDAVHRMADAVREHPIAGPLLATDHRELSGVWTDEAYGVRSKVRLDAVAPEGLVDLKKTTDARAEPFGKIAHNLKYVRQGAFYMRYASFLGLHRTEFFFVVCEGERPHGVKVYRVLANPLVAAEVELDVLLDRYGECERTGVWPNYPAEIDELWIPPWASRSSEELVDAFEEVG